MYVPHPFDRMHSVPDYEHLLDDLDEIDAIEVFNPRVAISAFNDEAARFAAKYRIVAGAGSDSHVAQGLGSVRIAMRDFDGPAGVPAVAARRRHPHAAVVAALRAGAEVPADTRHAALGAPGEQGAAAEALRAQGAAVRRARARRARTQLLMHRQGQDDAPSNPSGPMPVTDDEIREKYLERAIRELNSLTRELQACPHCPRGNLMPVLGSGHPQADIMLLKYAPVPSEIEEGVAFYGRAGSAIMKSLKRLQIDPLAVYGTLCVKCPLSDSSLADFACISRVVEEIAIVQPKIIVVMGADALATLGEMDIPLARPLPPAVGEIQQLTPTIDALYVPDIDDSLDEQDAKSEFWAAFRVLGDWYAAQPPY